MGRRTHTYISPCTVMLAEVEVQFHRVGTWKPSPEWLAALDRSMGPHGFIGSQRAIFGTPEALPHCSSVQTSWILTISTSKSAGIPPCGVGKLHSTESQVPTEKQIATTTQLAN